LTKPNLSAGKNFVGLPESQVYKVYITHILPISLTSKANSATYWFQTEKFSATRNDLSARCNAKCRSGDIGDAESLEQRNLQML